MNCCLKPRLRQLRNNFGPVEYLVAHPTRASTTVPLEAPPPLVERSALPARYNSRMNWQERISVNPALRSGKPCIKGTRITVYDVLEYLAGGMSEDQILGDFPDLTREDIRACLAFAAARERRLANSLA